MFIRCFQQHARGRLAAVARGMQVMRAAVDLIDSRSCQRQRGTHLVVQRIHVIHRNHSLRKATLVGGKEQRKPLLLSKEIASATNGRNSTSAHWVICSPFGAGRLMTPSRSRNATLFRKYGVLNQFCDDVAHQNMAFLNAWRFVRRRAKAILRLLPELPASTACQRDGVQP